MENKTKPQKISTSVEKNVSEHKVVLSNEIFHKKFRICEVCGHTNLESTAICEMCSNYLILGGED